MHDVEEKECPMIDFYHIYTLQCWRSYPRWADDGHLLSILFYPPISDPLCLCDNGNDDDDDDDDDDGDNDDDTIDFVGEYCLRQNLATADRNIACKKNRECINKENRLGQCRVLSAMKFIYRMCFIRSFILCLCFQHEDPFLCIQASIAPLGMFSR